MEGNNHLLEELSALKNKIQQIADFNENSVTSIISQATNNCQTLQNCLQLMVNQCNRKQNDIVELSQICFKLVDKHARLWREQECLLQKNIDKDDLIEKNQKQYHKLQEKNDNLKEQLQEAMKQLFQSEEIFEREKKLLKDEINEQIQNYIADISKNQEQKFKQLANHIKQLQEQINLLREQAEVGKQVINEMTQKNQQIQAQKRMIERHLEQFKDDFIELDNQCQKLKNDNQILCNEIKQIYMKTSSSTSELVSVGSSGNLNQKQQGHQHVNGVEREFHENYEREEKKLDTRDDEFIYRVKSFERLSSVTSLINLGDLNFDTVKNQGSKKVSIGTQTDQISNIPKLDFGSPIKALNSPKDMKNSFVFQRVNNEQINKNRMSKKNKVDTIYISQYDNRPTTDRSFVSSLVAKRTRKPKVSQSIMEIQQRKKKSALSFLQNNSFTQRLVSSRIKKKTKNRSMTESCIVEKTQPSLFDSICNLVIKK